MDLAYVVGTHDTRGAELAYAARGEPIIGGGAGTGLSAKCEEEVDLVAAARAHDLLTTPYVFSAADARAMSAAGADVVVAHMGLTTGGSIGAETAKSLDDCVALTDGWAAAAREVRDDVLVLCHGGPIAMPDDAAYVLSRTHDCHGFYGASSMERLPNETAITEQVRAFRRAVNRESH